MGFLGGGDWLAMLGRYESRTNHTATQPCALFVCDGSSTFRRSFVYCCAFRASILLATSISRPEIVFTVGGFVVGLIQDYDAACRITDWIKTRRQAKEALPPSDELKGPFSLL